MVAAKDFICYAQIYEELGMEFYARLGARMRIPEIAEILALLNDQEQHHYQVLAALHDQKKPPDRNDSSGAIVHTAKSLYYIASQYPALGLAVLFDWEAYHKALECEKKNIQFYEQSYSLFTNKTWKKALSNILEEEKKHAAILSSIMDIGRSMVEESMITRNDGM